MHYQQSKIAGFNCLEIPGDPEGPTIILFHGFGANAENLAPLNSVYTNSPKPRWIFPEGPLDVPLNGGYMGKAWFPLDIQKMQNLALQKDENAVSELLAPKLISAAESVQNLIKEIDPPKSRTFLGGFSQGAVLATELLLSSQEHYGGLILLSGTMVKKEHWSQLSPHHKNTPFFQSHGKNDPLLPYHKAEELFDLLKQSGFKGELSSFDGGHDIPNPILIKLHQFCRTQFKT